MADGIKLTGFNELHDALGQLTKATERTLLRRIAMKALVPMRDAAKRLAPVDEGRLRDSIVIGTVLSRRAKAMDKMEPRNGVRVFCGTANRNAVPREFGSERSPAQPFFRPAWDATKDQVLQSVQAQLGPEIEKTAARAAKRKASK